MKKLFWVILAVLMLCAANAAAESTLPEIHISGRYVYQLQDDGTAYIINYLGDPGDGIFPPHTIDGYPASSVQNLASGRYDPQVFLGEYYSYIVREDGTAEIYCAWAPMNDPVIPESIAGFSVSAVNPNFNEGYITSGLFEYILRGDGTAEIVSWTGMPGSDLIIPEQVDGHPVAVLGSGLLTADMYRMDKHRVFIPSTVTAIRSTTLPSGRISEIIVDPANPIYYVQDGMLINGETKAVLRYADHEQRTHINIPEGIQLIHEYAFEGAQYATSIFVADSVKKIGKRAFSSFLTLEQMTIPSTIEYIGDMAFRMEESEELIIIGGMSASPEETEDHVDWVDVFGTFRKVRLDGESDLFAIVNDCLYDKKNNILLKYCPQSEPEKGTFTIPAGTASIAEGAFSSAMFTHVILPDGITYLMDNAFSGCATLKSIEIPQGVTEIGKNAFNGCSALENIVIPESVTEIGESAFYGCTSLKNLTLPGTVTVIGDSAFAKCESLETLILPEGLTRIEDGMFEGCSALTAVVIPDTVQYLGVGAFRRCTALAGITLPEGIPSIDIRTFEGCTKLSSVSIPASVMKIGKNAFAKCKPVFTVVPGSYGETWCQDNGFSYIYAD